jgi:hypothetical protein
MPGSALPGASISGCDHAGAPPSLGLVPKSGSVPSVVPPGAPSLIPKKMSYNAVPPPAGSGSEGGDGGAVYLDGQKVADILMGYMARSMGGPAQGSPYFDGTASAPAQDLSLSCG